jgi:cytoskeletal protein RodZ
MSIGERLGRARQDARLSITQVSEQTRIRETVICGIEHDDFSPCGGDFYARGHIRSVARVVGVDAAPLIQEYDATTTPGRNQPVLVQLAATEGCWVGVYGPDGALRWQVYIPAGAARSWVFTHRVSMKIGNPRGIVLTVNGRKMTSLGSGPITLNLQPGQTVRS